MRRVDLAQTVVLTASGITRLLDGLERAGYVEKDTCATDGRVSYAKLTVDRPREAQGRCRHPPPRGGGALHRAGSPTRARAARRAARPPAACAARTARSTRTPAATALAEERLRGLVPGVGHELELGRRLRERHRDDLVAVQRRHLAPVARLRRGRRPRARSGARGPGRAEWASRRAGCSRARSPAPACRCGPRPPARRSRRRSRFSTRTWPKSSTSPSSLTPGSSAPSLATITEKFLPARPAPLDRRGDVVVDDRLLGDEDVVGAARDPAHQRDPARVAAHRLDDDDPAVRLGRRVAAVDRLGRDVHGRVEAERVVGAVEVVVDRLRDADDRQALLGEELARRRRACPRRRSRPARRSARTSS